MPDTTAKIRSKGLDSTGVTEEVAAQMYNSLGRYTMAIVELKHEDHGKNAEGKRRVELVITMVEPALDDTLENHLRELTRTLDYNRRLTSPDQELPIDRDANEPTVEGVVAAAKKLEPHPFVDTNGVGDEYGTCDVCGDAPGDPRHQILGDADDQGTEEPDPDAAPDAAAGAQNDPWKDDQDDEDSPGAA